MIRTDLLLFLAFILPGILLAQDLNSGMISNEEINGSWEGLITQANSDITFSVQVNITVNGSTVNGVSFSSVEDNSSSARFTITGYWNGENLVLQEIEQLEPESPKWCMKYMTLVPYREEEAITLKGDWKASGCSPGKVYLKKKLKFKEVTVEKEVPFTLEGQWTGALSQSDRDYGFYYTLNLEDSSTGKSNINSDGDGGNATHQLTYLFDEGSQSLQVEELEVLNRTVPDWRWCIKMADLKLRKESHRYVLEGRWKGYIEGYTIETGPCASGKLTLEKPILTETVRQKVAEFVPYKETTEQREVKVTHVIEVTKPNIRLKVWDNGTVDGDVVTLFLNGEQLLMNHRVTKRRHTMLVRLKEENNFLVLHADDLGDIMPNTVAVAVDDGEREQTIILSSNLRESGAVMIRQFKVN